MKTTTLTLPAFWASALINNDYTGYNYADAATIRTWLADTREYGPALSCSDEPFFIKTHGAYPLVLACECLDYVFPVVEKKQ